MIKTVDNKGIERTMSLVNWNNLTINSDGSRGQNHLRPINDEKPIDAIDEELKKFIELKQSLKEKKAIAEPVIIPEVILAEPKELNYPSANEGEVVQVTISNIEVDEISGQPIEKKSAPVKPSAKRATVKKSK